MNSNSSPGLHPECYVCLLQQAVSTTREAGLGSDDTREILDAALRRILEARSVPTHVQHVTREVADLTQAKLGKDREHDLYAEIKRKSHLTALSFLPAFRETLRSSEDPLATGVRIAAAGNIIDFGAKDHGSLDLNKELSSLDNLRFGRDDLPAFRERLGRTSLLLYLCDNVGEILFDRLLMEVLLTSKPGLRIVAAVRDKPIINDATLSDARESCLDEVAELISSGSVLPGTLLEECTPEFCDLYHKADLVLSKGQGNFETLRHQADERVFLLLRVKCDTMARLSGLCKGDLVFMQGGS